MGQPYWQRAAARQIQRGLATAGAKSVPVHRQPMDANGVATGEPVRAGCLFGVLYTRGQVDTILIATPGVVARTDSVRFLATLQGCARSMSKGDLLDWPGQRYKVLQADIHLEIALILILEEV